MEKVYVDYTNQASIICPNCGLAKNKDVKNFRDTHKKLKAKCRCGQVFRFTLEFRKQYRKKVRLAGEYYILGKNEKGEIVIEDISATGIRFETLKPHYISRGDIVELKFNLDNPGRTGIQELVKIVWIIDRSVGAQFNDPKSLEKDLGFYLKK